jgi:hypothetical protein
VRPQSNGAWQWTHHSFVKSRCCAETQLEAETAHVLRRQIALCQKLAFGLQQIFSFDHLVGVQQ